MIYRRAIVGLVLLLVGLAGRVPGQVPARPIPTTKIPLAKTTQIPGDLAQPGEPFAPGDLPPMGPPPLPPAGPGMVPGPGGEDDDCDPLDPPAPCVRIRVRVPSVAPAGKELEYRLIVENTGKGAAHHTTVRATLPASVRLVRANPEPTTTDPEPRWQLGTLPGCGTKEITLVVVPTGEADVRVCARVGYEYGQCVQTRIAGKMPGPDDRNRVPLPMPGPEPGPLPQPPMGNPNLTLKVTVPPQPAMLFGSVPCTIEVANTGTAPARDVNVAVTLAPGLDVGPVDPPEKPGGALTWALGTIGPRQQKRIELQLILKKTGLLTVDAEVTDAGGQKKTERGQVQVSEAKLDLVMKGPDRRRVGGNAIYTMQVINTGDVAASNVVVTDDIPDQIELVNASPPGKKVGTAVQWDLGTLAPRERRLLQLEIRCKVAGTLKNRATVKASQMEMGVTAEAETVFENVTGLTVEIDSNAPLLKVGETGVYTIRVINQGEGEVENLGLTVTLPPELTLVDADGPNKPLQGEGPIAFPPLVKIPGKQTREYKVRAKATMVGDIKVRVEVTAKQLTRSLLREEATTIYR